MRCQRLVSRTLKRSLGRSWCWRIHSDTLSWKRTTSCFERKVVFHGAIVHFNVSESEYVCSWTAIPKNPTSNRSWSWTWPGGLGHCLATGEVGFSGRSWSFGWAQWGGAFIQTLPRTARMRGVCFCFHVPSSPHHLATTLGCFGVAMWGRAIESETFCDGILPSAAISHSTCLLYL